MKKFKSHTLKDYSKSLSTRAPVPGGGSAAALTACLGASLISMVANYSLGRKKTKRVEAKIKTIISSIVSGEKHGDNNNEKRVES